MNYKKDISFNSCKVIVEFTFSTFLVLVFTFCLLVLFSMSYLEQFIFCRTLWMDVLTGSTSVSLIISKVEIYYLFYNIELNYLCIYLWVYSSYIGSQMYTRDRETRFGPVISLDLEKASLHIFLESTYPDA